MLLLIISLVDDDILTKNFILKNITSNSKSKNKIKPITSKKTTYNKFFKSRKFSNKQTR